MWKANDIDIIVPNLQALVDVHTWLHHRGYTMVSGKKGMWETLQSPNKEWRNIQLIVTQYTSDPDMSFLNLLFTPANGISLSGNKSLGSICDSLFTRSSCIDPGDKVVVRRQKYTSRGFHVLG